MSENNIHMKKTFIISILNIFLLISLSAQETITIKGYISAEGNQGYISNADVIIQDKTTKENIKFLVTDDFGTFSTELEKNRLYTVTIQSELYIEVIKDIDTSIKNDNKQVFLKAFMKRKPGYIFEISLTEIRLSPSAPVDGITDALVEVYNNTKEKSITSFYNTRPNFDINLTKGNHYTILIRKKGYMAKQLEAYLNINGCIICFDGVSKMQPGVKSKLSADNTIGNYRATIELDKVFKGKRIKINNIYYDLNKAFINAEAAKELDNLAKILKLNPGLLVELGSHTDSRGSDEYNLKLSSSRAKAAVSYLTKVKNIDKKIISYKGYGETELVNKCKNGVQCTETEHALNRRTEIKILGILQNENEEYIPLEVQKNKERMEQKYDEILNSDNEIIEIKDGDLPEEIKKDIEKSNNSRKKTKVKKYDEKETPIIKVKKEVEDEVKDNDDIKSKKTNNIQSERNKKNNSDIKSNSESSITSTSKKGFTGYKIVILFTKYPLPKGHIIFKNNKGLEEYNNNNDGYILYLVGEYDTYEAAKKDLENKWKKSYKKSYIIRMENGIKTSL